MASSAADLILHNGEIISLDQEGNVYEAIAIKDERIIEIGSNEKVLTYRGNQTKVIDLNGRTVVPGFTDSHQHFYITGLAAIYMDCNLSSIQEIVKLVEKKASQLPKDKWIVGFNYNDSKFLEGRDLNKADFKHIEHPVFIMRYDQHSVCVNDVALKMMNIDKNTVIEGGIIEKDENSELTGLLREAAFTYAKKFVPLSLDDLMKMALYANDHNIKYGITSVHDAGLGFYSGSFDEYHVLEKLSLENQLKVRVYGMILDKFIPEALELGLATGVTKNRLKVGSYKIFADGTWGSMTAGISEEYPTKPGYKGFIYSDIKEKIFEAQKHGFQIATHAMGDRAIEQVLTYYEEAMKKYPRNDTRHRIEHASATNEKIIRKMKELGVIPMPLTQLLYNMGDYYIKYFPKKLLDRAYEVKTFIEEGLKPAANSDSPVNTVSPMFGMFTLMTRVTREGVELSPHQRVSLYEALEMYTKNGAYASFDENDKGTLEVGKLGDLVVLPEKFIEFDANTVRDTEVEMTIIGGEIVYEKASS